MFARSYSLAGTVDLFGPAADPTDATAAMQALTQTGRAPRPAIVLCWHCDEATEQGTAPGWVTATRGADYTVGICPTCLATHYNT